MAHITVEFEDGTVAYTDCEDDDAERMVEWFEAAFGRRMNIAT